MLYRLERLDHNYSYSQISPIQSEQSLSSNPSNQSQSTLSNQPSYLNHPLPISAQTSSHLAVLPKQVKASSAATATTRPSHGIPRSIRFESKCLSIRLASTYLLLSSILYWRDHNVRMIGGVGDRREVLSNGGRAV